MASFVQCSDHELPQRNTSTPAIPYIWQARAGEPDEVKRQMAGSVASIASLMSACALPSPWEAINMLKCVFNAACHGFPLPRCRLHTIHSVHHPDLSASGGSHSTDKAQ